MSSPKVRSVCSVGVAGVLAALVVGAGGCSSEGPQPIKVETSAERAKTLPTDYTEWSKIGYRPDWAGFPAVSGNVPTQLMQPYGDIVVTVEGNVVSILEGGTGTKRCSTELATGLTRFLGIARDSQRTYIASDSDVYVLDPQTCNMVTRQKIEKLVTTEPVMSGEMLIFGTGTGEVLAHLTRSGVGGVKAWGFALNGAIEHKPAIVGTAVGAVSQQGQVVLLDAATGGFQGKNFVYSGLACDPVGDDHLFYVASLDQSIYAFNPIDASLVWRVRTASPLRVQPTAYANRLYCAVPGQGLTAYDTSSGQVVWSCKNFGGTVVAARGQLLIGFDKSAGEAVTIDRERGDVVGRAKVKGAVMIKPDTFENGNLFVLSTSGLVGKYIPVK